MMHVDQTVIAATHQPNVKPIGAAITGIDLHVVDEPICEALRGAFNPAARRAKRPSRIKDETRPAS
jgi:hypothetical protein